MNTEIKYVIDSGTFLDLVTAPQSPFVKLNHRQKFLRVVGRTLLLITESFFSNKVFFSKAPSITDYLKPATVRAIHYLLDRGVVTHWYERYLNPALPEVFHVTFELASVKNGIHESFLVGGAGEGSDFSPENAVQKAIAEAVERYEIQAWVHKVTKPKNSDSRKGIDQDAFLPYGVDQSKINFKMFSRMKAKDFQSGKTFYVPAFTVFINHPDVNLVYSQNSIEITTDGVAAGSSLDQAKVHSILEKMERHDLVKWWLEAGGFKTRIDHKSLPSDIGSTFRELELRGLRCYLFEIDSVIDGLFTFVVIICSDSTQRKIVMSAACGFSSDVVIQKLEHESLKHLHVEDKHTDKLVHKNYNSKDFAQVIDLLEQKDYAAEIENLCRITPINYTSHHSEYFKKSYSEQLQYLKKSFSNNNIPGYFVDLSSEVSNALGLKVVRFVSPNLVPLYFNQLFKDQAVGIIKKTNPDYKDKKPVLAMPFI